MMQQSLPKVRTSSSSIFEENQQRSAAIEELIEACLIHFCREDATILAEAYFAKTHCENSLRLLCHSMVQARRWDEAYHTLKNNSFSSPECRFLFARAAFETGRINEAESALRDFGDRHHAITLHREFQRTRSGPFAHVLLARILSETNRAELAKNHLELALKLQPLLWSAVKKYCELGGEGVKELCRSVVTPNEQAILHPEMAERRNKLSSQSDTESKQAPRGRRIATTRTTPEEIGVKRRTQLPQAPKKKPHISQTSLGGRRAKGSHSVTKGEHPAESVITRRSPRLLSAHENENNNSHVPPYHLRSSATRSATALLGSNLLIPSSLPACKALFKKSTVDVQAVKVKLNEVEQLKLNIKQDQRLRRTHAHPLSSVNSPNTQQSAQLSSLSSPLLDAHLPPMAFAADSGEPMDLENSDPSEQQIGLKLETSRETDVTPQEESPSKAIAKSESSQPPPDVDHTYNTIHEWFLMAAEMHEHLSHYRCAEALQVLNSFVYPIADTPLILELRARAFFEKSDYKKACDLFEEIRRCHPHRAEGMEVYSTALWQLQNSHQLSALSAEMSLTARDKPQTWCAVGNCFSLEKKHEMAVEALARAIQLDPTFGYAYSLLGHELIDLNKLPKAAQAFQRALVHSPNDYRAWYGLCLVHYRDEQVSLAKMHIQRAIRINPANVALLCQAAVIEQSLHNSAAAMEYVERALQQAPNNVACRYHKARLLFDTGYYAKALEELTELKSLSPDEAHVFFLLGRVYRKLGDNHKALLHFSWATEIDPRGEQNSSALSNQVTYDDGPVDFSAEAGSSNASF